jgi:signal transduction histidine kinase
MNADKFHLVPSSWYLLPTLDRCMQLVSHSAAQKGIDLMLTLTPRSYSYTDSCLFSDSQRFSQIILNLLSNAVKFTISGSVHVLVDLVLIETIHSEDSPNHISISAIRPTISQSRSESNFPSLLLSSGSLSLQNVKLLNRSCNDGEIPTLDETVIIYQKKKKKSSKIFQESKLLESKCSLDEMKPSYKPHLKQGFVQKRKELSDTKNTKSSKDSKDSRESKELKITIQVRDTGIGIKKEDQKRLFSLYSQVGRIPIFKSSFHIYFAYLFCSFILFFLIFFIFILNRSDQINQLTVALVLGCISVDAL